MRPANVSLIFRKELRDVLRDRRTLLATFILPLVLYPGFVIGFVQVTAVKRGQMAQEVYTLAVAGREYAADLVAAVRPEDRLTVVDVPPDVEEAIRSRRLQLLVEAPPQFRQEIEGETTASLVVRYDESDERSRSALARFQAVAQRYQEGILLKRLGALDPPRTAPFVEPVRLVRENVAPETRVLLSAAGGALVFLAVMMALTGAFYPAVDACAGEKERGTIETLLVSPATRTEIVLGKYVLVLTMSLATAVLNLLSMGLTIVALVRMQGAVEQTGMSLGIGQVAQALPSLVWVFVLLVPVAGLFSALSLAVASFARSTKEAQYYMLPLYLVALPLAGLGLVRGMELTYVLDLVPVAGAAVVFQNLLVGRSGTAPHAVVVFAANFAYALVAIRWAVGLFRREDILFREAEEFQWRFWRWPSFRPVNGRPATGHVILAYGVGILLIWYLSAFLARMGDAATASAVQQVVAVGLPALVLAAAFRLRWRATFRLRLASGWVLLLTLPLTAAAHILMVEFAYTIRRELPMPPELERFLRDLPRGRFGVAGALVSLTLLPAVCEEWLFRGFILSGLRSRMKAVGAVVTSAMLFGIFHLNVYQFLYAVLGGLVLGALALRTRSLLPAVLFHLTNNLLGYFIMLPEEWPGWLRRALLVGDEGHYGAAALLSALPVGVLSLLGIWRLSRRGRADAEDDPVRT